MKKEPFVTLEKLRKSLKSFRHLFIFMMRRGSVKMQALKEAFAWNKGFKEFFAVKQHRIHI